MQKTASHSLINGIRIFWEQTGDSGDGLVLVHGSWGDHHNWDAVVPALAQHFRVLTYDRRGHSQSERPDTQGSVEEDVSDLASLMGELGFARAHVAGNSFGASIALRLASQRPELFATLTAHEPPLFALISDDAAQRSALANAQARIGSVVARLEAGEVDAGTQEFVESIAFGPGSWSQLPLEVQQAFIFNAPTWLDEMHDAGALSIDLASLHDFQPRALLTVGGKSAPFFPPIVECLAKTLPHVERHTFEGGGHVPHVTHPDEYVRTVARFAGAR